MWPFGINEGRDFAATLQNIVSIFFLDRTHFLAVSPTYGKVEYLPQTEAEFTRSVNIVDLYL